jgi:hypothetical protein
LKKLELKLDSPRNSSCRCLKHTHGRGGGLKNVTDWHKGGGGVQNCLKIKHVLFEWPLITSSMSLINNYINQMFICPRGLDHNELIFFQIFFFVVVICSKNGK